MHDTKEVGCTSFIMVDMPPEEAKDFWDLCANEGLALRPLAFWDVLMHSRYRLSYIPLIAQAHIQFLASRLFP